MNNSILVKEIINNIGILTLNRPEKRNALSQDLLLQLHGVFQEWRREDKIRCVVIKGSGNKSFCSGYDISSIPKEVDAQTMELLKTSNPLELALDSIRNYPYPVIAMLNGYTFGAGLNLAICCDIRIAADHIKAGMPPVKLGLVYHPNGLKQFISVLGMAKTRELFLTGRVYKEMELFEMGIVNHLMPAQKLDSAVMSMAEEISGNAPISVKGIKKFLNRLDYHEPWSEKETIEAEMIIAESFNSEDLKEGQAAFFGKRKPLFTGS
jgi:enoyl-CoA hydratase